jgi:cytochrome c
LSKLFELGPAAYTPGTKMPEQRIGSREDRAALIRFLEAATKRR